MLYFKVSVVDTNLKGKVIIEIGQIAVQVETINIVANHTHGKLPSIQEEMPKMWQR